MNFYNPYYFPYQSVGRPGMLSNLIKKINFSSILSGTQKTLNTVNQIIPLVKEARPMVNNAKTMFKLMSEFSRNDNQEKNTVKKDKKKTTSNEVAYGYIGGPTFFQ